MREQLRTLPNQLTALRLLLVPAIWMAAMYGLAAVVATGLAVAAATDALDGFLARRLGQESTFGSRLDTVADTLTMVSALAWTLMLRPEVISDHPVVLPTTATLALVSVTLGWIRFRRVADLHLYTARAAAIVGYPFLVHALLTDRYLAPLFYLGIALALTASIEALVVQITRTALDGPVGSVVLLRGTANGRRSAGR